MNEFSFFRCPITRTVQDKTVSLSDVYKVIKDGTYRWPIEALRSLKDDKARREYKGRELDFVTFSGVFSKRCKDGLVAHSGYICLDFDHVANFERLWRDLKGDKGTDLRMLFRSPSGDGIKAVYYVGEILPEEHEGVFEMLSEYVATEYGVKPDPSGRDVCRPCYLSDDREAYMKSNINL